MTRLLDHALRSVADLLRSAEVGRSVVRVDVRRDGALDLCLDVAGAMTWFRFSDAGLRRFEPGRDEALPLAGELERRYGSDWTVLAYRPGRRLVVDLPKNGVRLVAKGYRRRRSEVAARNHRIAARVNNGSAFRIPRLIEDDSSTASLVFERLAWDGIRLHEQHQHRFFSIGVALRRLQEAGCEEGLDPHTADDELAVLDRWERAHRLALGEPPRAWCESRDRVVAVRSELPPAVDSLCHRDLHDGQFLASDDGVALLDFDLLCCADAALDPANLLAHLTLRAMQGIRGASEQSVLACGELFMDGLDHEDDDEFWSRLRFYQSTSFLRLALIYSLRPRWKHLCEPLTEMGRLCLKELEDGGGR